MSDNPNEALSYEEVEEKEEKETEKQTSKSKSSYVSLDASAGFKDMLLKPAIMKAITDCGFEHPSEVQQQCIPQAIYGTDILCQAKSGMGKTAVFSLSALQLIDEDLAEIQVLVLCHTRELAFQVHREFERFSKYMREKIKLAVFYGGHPIADHIKILNEPKKPQILVGTPGRINQLIRDGHLKLNKLKIFVLDECDNMLEKLDMRGDVQSIFKATPKNKQVMMFTATLPEEIRQVCRKFMNSPVEILVDNESKLTLHGLKQYYSQVEEQGKTKKLIDLLDKLEFHQVVIFVNKVDRAEILNSVLTKSNFPSICIHSSLTQPERISRYEKFKNFEKRVMVATDLFGRGIDIERVNIVFNYDMSDSPDQYLHRVGRAGRFGTKGLAISFVTSKDAEILEKIQAKFEVQISPLPNEIDVSTYM